MSGVLGVPLTSQSAQPFSAVSGHEPPGQPRQAIQPASGAPPTAYWKASLLSAAIWLIVPVPWPLLSFGAVVPPSGSSQQSV